ncbi:MAG: hypothetical protein M3155_01585 [Actinomycetota bacterium]|nr:hypothetical protein [Actinomycetota bacterium]
MRGTELPVIADCRLDLPGLRAQRERYRQLGDHVAGIDRGPRSFTVRFDPAVDRELVEDVVAVERGCCPFFKLGFDAGRRRLTVSVDDPRQAPALEALLFALGRG